MAIIEDTPEYQLIRTVLPQGAIAEQVVWKPGTRQANALALNAKANAALAANATFLALGAPTNPQVLAQVQLLTREVNALIRLALSGDALLDTTNT